MSECATINAQVLFEVANLNERPARRRSREELEASFAGTPLAEAVELLDLWPPERALARYFEKG